MLYIIAQYIIRVKNDTIWMIKNEDLETDEYHRQVSLLLHLSLWKAILNYSWFVNTYKSLALRYLVVCRCVMFADINNIILLKYMYKHRVKLSIKVWWAIYCKHWYILTVLIKCKVPALTFGYYFNHYKHNWPPHCVISSLINGLSLCWLWFDEVTRDIINIILPVNCDCHKCIM